MKSAVKGDQRSPKQFTGPAAPLPRETTSKASAAAQVPGKLLWWHVLLGAVIATACALWAYGPALHGEFVFDDLHLPFTQPAASTWPVRLWLSVRPVTMLTYWANIHTSGLDPYWYHVWNVLFHSLASVLLFFIVRKTLEWAATGEPQRTILALFAGAVFLLHPAQTEGVAYVAGRAENVSALFFLAAWCLFLYRRNQSVTWLTALGVLVLFGAAVGSKEHTVVLPAVLLLTDYFWNPRLSWEGAKRNWKLYAPIFVFGLLGAIFVLQYIRRDTVSIGFSLKEFTWYQYLFTQFRVFFGYLVLAVFPLWQTVDYDVSVSHTFFQHGAFLGLLGILLLTALAWHYRRRFPLASYGFFVFGTLLAPTSSFIPIKDVMADRRLYLPLIGLLFIVLELLRHWKTTQAKLTATLAAVVVLCGIWTYNRSEAWSSALNLWTDTAIKAPNKQRVQFGLAVAQFRANHCKDAVKSYARAAELEKPDYTMLMNWSLAYECADQPKLAREKMQESIDMHPSAESWASMAVLDARLGKMQEPLDDLNKAQTLNAAYTPLYLYRGKIHIAMKQWQDAQTDFRTALSLEPDNVAAKQGLDAVEAQMRSATQ